MKRKRNHHARLPKTMIVCCGMTASAVFAQDGTESSTTLPTVHVVSQKQDTPIRYQSLSSSSALFADTPLIETPFSISVYNEELIEDQRAFRLEDVLKNDPSVGLQMPSGFYSNQNLGLRGFQVDNFVGYRVDGLPVMNLTAPFIDDKSRVEVLKGPAALRYGFMPPGGSINLVRKRPTQDFSTSLHFDVDSFGSLYSQVDVSDTVAGGKFGYRVVLAGDEFDSYYDNAGGDRLLGSVFAEWKPTETLTVWGSFASQDRQRNGYYGPLITENGNVLDTGVKTNTMQDWARNEQEAIDTAVGVDIDLNPDWKLRTSFNYQDTQRSTGLSFASAVKDNGDFEDYGFMLGDNLQQWETWAGHMHVEGTFDTGAIKHDIVVGGQYRDLNTRFGTRAMPFLGMNNAYNLINYPRPADPTLSWDAYEYKETGLFFTDTIHFTEKFSALVGLRYGKIDIQEYWQGALDYKYKETDWSPTIALMYEPIENVNTYLTYTEGMQDGGLTPFRGVANPYEPLGVRHSEQWEAGVKASFLDNRISGELAVFQIEQDLAITDAAGIHGFNGLQRHRGVELAVRGMITDEWQAGLSAMFLDAEQKDTNVPDTEGRRPRYVPEYQVNLWSVLEIPQVPGLALTAGVRLVDKQFLDQEETVATDNYTVVDVGARYQFEAADADWTVRLNVHNVLDERYFESGEYTKGDAGYLSYGSPVAATLSLQIDF